MVERKYFTELAVSFSSMGTMLLHPKNIKGIETQSEEYRDIADNCHIYLIAKRPRVTFVPDSIEVGEGKTSGLLRYLDKGKERVIKFSFNGEANADVIKISDYPHNEISFIKNGKRIFSGPAHLLSLISNEISDPSIRDLEVVYVGMSYANGKRSAKDRLLSHSTLQSVLSDLNHDEPDTEALIIMAEFTPQQTMISFDGSNNGPSVEDDRDVVQDINRQLNDITKKQQICLIEASLIRYFEPYYNDKYKKYFPVESQKILKEMYEIDFSGITVELNTEILRCRLFSENRAAGFHHIASFDLHDQSKRKSFFNFAEIGTDAGDFSGAIF
ncbi:hypothetical protein M634_11105 [Vibrio parahaemolyticus O1:Kuk str. FDA_R31]|uniref:hypothetical protein n=1 Tax=Vibrio harveyi group TaxID=717610 RepID=UPI000359227A|nr:MULTISPECIES: hypothetical protein [Vibrio harveyi group]AGQ92287.1 hypothetical protein M634_11105 [Vibrio parahaemolyticus O1:Kuk str. FDA_R31]EJB5289973.1 hypothetical protein [Vibrio parahaemolyticus]EJG2016827.1 hypothetical protein [Vibrio parahaemolyticus]EJG2030591.1 hypothetical protein [Vibrio parahaemolyticus]EKA6057086.1 hypothetical protein [Vibrio parahaemolyticus]